MGKKKKKSKAVRKAKDTIKEDNVEVETDVGQYGGLPQRDLKKNLGCG